MQNAVELARRARRVADDVLFPVAAEVDRSGILPPELLDLLAAEGFYGVSADPGDGALVRGGLDVPGLAGVGPIVEALAGGCLSAAFVWIQHLGVVRGVSSADDPAVRDRWLSPLVSGRVPPSCGCGVRTPAGC